MVITDNDNARIEREMQDQYFVYLSQDSGIGIYGTAAECVDWYLSEAGYSLDEDETREGIFYGLLWAAGRNRLYAGRNERLCRYSRLDDRYCAELAKEWDADQSRLTEEEVDE